MSLVDYERPALFTVEEAAEYLSVPVRFVRRIRYENRLPGVKLGKHLRFRKEDLDRYIENGTEGPIELDRSRS